MPRGHTLVDLPQIGVTFLWVCSCGEEAPVALSTVDEALSEHAIHAELSVHGPAAGQE